MLGLAIERLAETFRHAVLPHALSHRDEHFPARDVDQFRCQGDLQRLRERGPGISRGLQESGGCNADQVSRGRLCCGIRTQLLDARPNQGCMAGYPVTWCEWDGGHSTPNFATDAVWEFFSQF